MNNINNKFGIIEIGSNNTKIHIYKEEKLIYEKTITIELKKNYQIKKQINEEDINKLYEVIENALTYTNNINIYGCSIFRNISNEELDEINKKIYEKYQDMECIGKIIGLRACGRRFYRGFRLRQKSPADGPFRSGSAGFQAH